MRSNIQFLFLICFYLFLTETALPQNYFSQNLNYSIQDTLIASEYFSKADIFSSAAQYDSSNYYFEKAIEVYESLNNEYDDEKFYKEILKCKNEIGWNLIMVGEYDKAQIVLNESRESTILRNFENSAELAQCYNNLGHTFYYKGDFDNSIKMHKQSLNIRRELFGDINEHVASSYNNLGINEIEKGNYDAALEYLNHSLSIILEVFGEEHIQTSYRLGNIGLIFREKGEYDKALEFYERAVFIQLRSEGEESRRLIQEYNNIGIIYNNKKEFDKALEYFQKSLSRAIKYLGEIHPSVGVRYLNIGISLLRKGEYKESIESLNHAENILVSALGEEHNTVAEVYEYKGMAYGNLFEFNNSFKNLDKALSIRKKIFGDKHPELAELYLSFSEVYILREDYINALNYIQSALNALIYDYNNHSIYHNPALSNISSEPLLLEALKLKTRLFTDLAVETGIDYLKIAFSTGLLAAELIDLMRTGYKSESSKLFLVENSAEVYDKVIQCALKLYQETEDQMYKQQAFILAEKSKAAVLQEGLAELDAKQFARLPFGLLEQEKQLKIDLAFYETQLQNEYMKKEARDSIKISSYENLLFGYKDKYRNLISDLEKEYPEYYNLKYQTKTTTIDEIQQYLPENTLMVEYFTGETSIFIFLISTDSFEILELRKPDNFYEAIRNFYSSILKSDLQNYIQYGNLLSKLLINPVIENADNIEKLIIIPHDLLNKIPFEALFTSEQNQNKKNYAEFNYVIKKYNMVYHYSASLYLNSLKTNSSAADSEKKFAGFAPVFPKTEQAGYTLASKRTEDFFASQNEILRSSFLSGNKFLELEYSKWEVESIRELLEKQSLYYISDAYFFSDATESNFKKNIKDYNIIHIATHSFINETYPQLSGIVFAQSDNEIISGDEGILYAAETYNLDLNADLVVLSSCESGLGKLIKGEGMMALTRGFLYSGALNIIFSLWKIPDKPTSELMIEFYRQMLSGKTYSESLRQAKLNMIQNQSTARPRSWASFILIGGD